MEIVVIDFDITDSWYNFGDLIEAGEYTISWSKLDSSSRGWEWVAMKHVDTFCMLRLTIEKEIRIAKWLPL